MKNISMKVADGVAFTITPEATFHCIPIPEGYSRVLVDEVVDPYSGLQLDIPGGDDERTLGESIHRIILWRKGLHRLSKATDTASADSSSKSATTSADSRSSKSDRKSTRLNSSHASKSRMPSSA